MIVTQTNDGLSTANSYVTTAELSAYASQRGIVLNSADLESLLFKSMDVLESKQYKSEPVKADQSTKWPRMGLGVPRDIKLAQIMLAINADSSIPITDTPTAAVKKEKVDVVEVEYFEPVSGQSALITMVDDLLKPYLAGGIGLNVRVYRGWLNGIITKWLEQD